MLLLLKFFGRMAKPLREQFSCVVRCRKYFGCLQRCQVISRDSIDEDKSDDSKLVGEVLFNSWYVHSRSILICMIHIKLLIQINL